MTVIVLDLETTGLDTNRDGVIEVAAAYMEPNRDHDALYFVPHHDAFAVQAAGEGLQVSRYFERGVWRNMLSATDTRDYYIDLWNMLKDNTIAGSNPRFDTNFLARTFRSMNLKPEPWHHRLLDLSAYAAGVLGLPLGHTPGLAEVCERLGVVFDSDAQHSAMGDVEVTRECFRKLVEIRWKLGTVEFEATKGKKK